MPRRRLSRALATLFVSSLILTGCAQLGALVNAAFKRPSFNFKQLQLLDANLGGATLNLIYQLDNPNPIGLSLAQVEYALFVENRQVVAGKPPNGLQISANRASDISFPTTVKFQDVAPVITTFLTKDRAKYRAQGALGVKTPLGILSFPLSKEGDFEVPKVPQIAFKPPRISNISLQGVTLDVPISLTNRNSFVLPLAGLTGAMSVAGVNVGNISTGNLGSISARSTRDVSIPVTLSLSSAPAAFAAVKNGRAQFALSGQVHSGSAGVPFSLNEVLSVQR